MPKEPARRVREQVVVYLDKRDRALLDKLANRTGLAKTELFRRGLRRLADETLGQKAPGFSLRQLVMSAEADDFPADVGAQPDAYLYGGAYQKRGRKKRA